MRGATGETFRGVKDKQESSLGSHTPKLPFASKGGGRIVSASRSPPGLDWILNDCSLLEDLFELIFCVFPMVWALFSRIVFGCEQIHFWSSFSPSGLFLEPFLALCWLFFQICWSICRSWAHFGSAGGQLFHHKNGLDHQRRPNRHFPQNIVTLWVPFWRHFSSIFRFLGLCFWASFFVEFRDRFFMDFGFISTHFFDIFLYLSTPLVLVFFDNSSIRKRVSCKSKSVKFITFSTCSDDFVSNSFFSRFCDFFDAIWGSIWHRFLRKNHSENRFKKRVPLFENEWLPSCPVAPRDAASRAHNSNKEQ